MENNEKIIYGKKHYSDELKHQICKEHVELGTGLNALKRKYSLSCHSLIHFWLREYGYIKSDLIKVKKVHYIGVENYLSLPEHNENADDDKSTVELATISQLKKELEEAKLLAEAFKRMIEIAETELKIPIRKKYNTK